MASTSTWAALADPHRRAMLELLREVEKIHAASSREVAELLRTASESEGSRQLDDWLKSYTTTDVNDL